MNQRNSRLLTLFSIGFSNRDIEKLMLLESGITALAGALQVSLPEDYLIP